MGAIAAGSAKTASTGTTGGAATTVMDVGADSVRSAVAQQASASACVIFSAEPSFMGLRIGHIAMRSQHDMRASAVAAQPAQGRQTPAMMPSVSRTAAMRRERVTTLVRMRRPPRGVNSGIGVHRAGTRRWVTRRRLIRIQGGMSAAVDMPRVSLEIEVPAAPPAMLTAQLLARIRGEFREMPGLTLTLRQASRLWSLDPVVCDSALRILVEERYLDQTRRGTFRLAD
jgi:hypothetical protein